MYTLELMYGFKYVAAGTLILFMFIVGFVTFTAFYRKSGNTGLDMAKIHLLRAPEAK